jgi:sugar lactone lactonase YvrE
LKLDLVNVPNNCSGNSTIWQASHPRPLLARFALTRFASERATLAAGLSVPAGLAATEDDLWVSEWASGRVLQLIADGQPLPEPRVVARGLAAPEGLAVASDGSLLVVESAAGRLARIDLRVGGISTLADGLALGAPGIPSLPPTWIFNGVAVGPSGAIYVTGDRANVLYCFERCGS